MSRGPTTTPYNENKPSSGSMSSSGSASSSSKNNNSGSKTATTPAEIAAWDANWNAATKRDIENFYNNVIKNNSNPAVQRRWQEQKAIIDSFNGDYVSLSKSGLLSPTTIFDGRSGKEYNFDWRTGKETGDRRLYDSNRERALREFSRRPDRASQELYSRLLQGQTGSVSSRAPQGKASPKSVAFNGNIKYGQKGSNIKEIQRIVGTGQDGSYGPKTQSAVKSWQARNGLTPNGVVDATTWAAMFKNLDQETEKGEQSYEAPAPISNDYSSRIKSSLAIGDVDAAESALSQRDAKIASMGEAGKQYLSSQNDYRSMINNAKSTGFNANVRTTNSPDYSIQINDAFARGDIEGAEEAIARRGLKIASMGETGRKYLQSQDDYTEMLNRAKASLPKKRTEELYDELEEMIYSTQKAPEDIENKILSQYQPIKVSEGMNYADALKMAQSRVDPAYDTASQQRMEALDQESLSRGFFGQLPAANRKFQESAQIENARKVESANLAQNLVNQSKEDAYRYAAYEQQERNARIENLLSAYNASSNQRAQNIAGLSDLLNSYRAGEQFDFNKKSQEWNQNFQSRQQAYQELVNEAEMTGKWKGNSTLNYQNMLKQWGINDQQIKMAMEEHQQNMSQAKVQLDLMKKQLANYGKPRGGGSSSKKNTGINASILLKVKEKAYDMANKEAALIYKEGKAKPEDLQTFLRSRTKKIEDDLLSSQGIIPSSELRFGN